MVEGHKARAEGSGQSTTTVKAKAKVGARTRQQESTSGRARPSILRLSAWHKAAITSVSCPFFSPYKSPDTPFFPRLSFPPPRPLQPPLLHTSLPTKLFFFYMPPRGNPPAGRGRGGPPARGGGPAIRGGAPTVGLPSTNAHVTTIGVKRTAFGTAGRPITLQTNHFAVKIPDAIIHHYDVIYPDEKTLPARLNMELVDRLQRVVAPQIFTPRAVYDGRKNMFAARELPFGDSNSQEFDVSLGDPVSSSGTTGTAPRGRGPKVYKIRLTWVAKINPEVLARFLEGKQSHDNTVLTAITALNVVIRQEPSLKFPFNVRSFFTDRETKDIGGGIILWRGYFQSVRPAVGKMLINVDISTGTMYKDGPLLGLCLAFFGKNDPNVLAPSRGFPDRERVRLQRFLSGVRVITKSPGQAQQARNTPRVVKKLTSAGATALTFTMREGGTMTVAQYFQRTYNYRLQFPDVICVEVGNGALIPLELCEVPKGQIMRKQVPPEKTKDVLDFATKKPPERLQSIANGLGVLSYGQSEYVRSFGLMVAPDAAPLSIQARVLQPPTLKYGAGSRQPTIQPRDGAWNMIDKKFWSPARVDRWVVVVYERQQRFTDQHAREMIEGLRSACKQAGMGFTDERPVVRWENGQGRIADQLKAAGAECNQKSGGFPQLIVAILPENGADIYTAIKHFGDITAGVATQCMKSDKCKKAKAQYYANVSLKMNVKLGGINTIPEPRSVSILTDPHNPTIVMGADVIHPAPGAEGRPSFTALVANVDSDTAKYIADCRVQTSRQELIEDLEAMSEHMLRMYMQYRSAREKKPNPAPKRIIFYRDGVSEGQFKQVLERELPLLKKACENLKINPTITVVVVGKRHHVRFFPQRAEDRDRSGNCPAGTVVDRELCLGLSTLLGTSRPAHYSVLHDENNFTPDGLQALSFALCHVYARSTRSVSIPAPVYYADIVCARAKNHYDPSGGLDFSDSATQVDQQAADKNLEVFKRGFKPLHKNMSVEATAFDTSAFLWVAFGSRVSPLSAAEISQCVDAPAASYTDAAFISGLVDIIANSRLYYATGFFNSRSLVPADIRAQGVPVCLDFGLGLFGLMQHILVQYFETIRILVALSSLALLLYLSLLPHKPQVNMPSHRNMTRRKPVPRYLPDSSSSLSRLSTHIKRLSFIHTDKDVPPLPEELARRAAAIVGREKRRGTIFTDEDAALWEKPQTYPVSLRIAPVQEIQDTPEELASCRHPPLPPKDFGTPSSGDSADATPSSFHSRRSLPRNYRPPTPPLPRDHPERRMRVDSDVPYPEQRTATFDTIGAQQPNGAVGKLTPIISRPMGSQREHASTSAMCSTENMRTRSILSQGAQSTKYVRPPSCSSSANGSKRHCGSLFGIWGDVKSLGFHLRIKICHILRA
ncbi:uncharacterized protein FIBRA_05298 [Fibroporia radiculosa]|uniref:Piwi domain-containing protein n=1 Tax=Fibroporia radiculosa TaxID=599839 RepID=J4IAM6_9APHY|nr:uncharacterized protein FIBRA_05298 [Fibroporia radiculosa]CCM03176.1 predicted protein [Fibroporia radiculosa]